MPAVTRRLSGRAPSPARSRTQLHVPRLCVLPGRVRPGHGDGIHARRPGATSALCEGDPWRPALHRRDPARHRTRKEAGVRCDTADDRLPDDGVVRQHHPEPGRPREVGGRDGRRAEPAGSGDDGRATPPHWTSTRLAELPTGTPRPSTVANGPARTPDGSLSPGPIRSASVADGQSSGAGTVPDRSGIWTAIE